MSLLLRAHLNPSRQPAKVRLRPNPLPAAPHGPVLFANMTDALSISASTRLENLKNVG